ncbi:MAG: hypothetical protein KA368_08295 [Acidobacteria bacterium]|nr:hypothetical protein [Acidobacteriota bacterium]
MDVVVTVPKNFEFAGKRGIAAWVAEGQLPGEPDGGEDWHFYMGGNPPNIKPGDRVYVVCEGKLRGYAPLVRVEQYGGSYALVRRGNAVAVTIDAPVRGFQGFRYRWWEREDEKPFPDWQEP